MVGNDLSPYQLHSIRNSVLPIVDYLEAVQRRMEFNQFPKNDRLYRFVSISHYVTNDLVTQIETLIGTYGAFEPTPSPFR